jgi:hypothetical protein
MVRFVNKLSVERILYAIFHRFNEPWKNRALRSSHKQLDVALKSIPLWSYIKPSIISRTLFEPGWIPNPSTWRTT